MRILLSWLRDFVDVPLGPAELGDLLSLRGFEVAAIEAPPPGPTAPGDRPAGGPDAVLDLEITPNRPDCLSVLGLAREVATACDLPFGDVPPGGPAVSNAGAAGHLDGLEVTIEDPDLCPRYAAGLAEVRVAPSPAWLANRLLAGGIRPINNVVDVTNYVLLEVGHPTHAFDFARLGGRALRIRRGRNGERVLTLDGEWRTVDPDMLVIADAARPQAVAGVMGGGQSEVGDGTGRIVLESAYFQPASVRRTSRRLGLKTEASARFERGADIGAPILAIRRVFHWLAAIGAGRPIEPVLDCYPRPRGPLTVALRRQRTAQVLGQAIDDADVGRIFAGLGFGVEPAPDGWRVTVPTARVDIAREIDLIEELARHYGYDRLPTSFPPLTTFPGRPDPRLERDRTIRRVLTAAGFSEAVTLAFIEQAAAAPSAGGAGAVALAYPLSEKFAVLRPSLLPGLVDAVGHNRRRERRDVRLFEVGARFSAVAGERDAVALAWTGSAAPEHWSGSQRAVDVFDLKGVVERLGEALGVVLQVRPAPCPFLVDGRAAAVTAGDEPLGVLGLLPADLAAARGLPAPDEVFVAEIDLAALGALGPAGETRAVPLPRFPSVVRDLSVVVDETLPAATVRGTIVAAAPATFAGLAEFDRYRGAGIPEGHVSLSFHLTFRAPDRTLTDAEVDRAMEAIVAALADRHGAVRR